MTQRTWDMGLGRHGSPSGLSPKDWLSVAKGGWARSSEHNMGLIAAGVAFYLFLAMVPLLAAMVMLYGILADPGTVARHVAALSESLPPSAAAIIKGQLESVVETSDSAKGFGLAIALALALFGARNGAGSMMIALNVAFECPEERNFVKKNAVALAITFGGATASAVLFAGLGAFSALEALVAPGNAVMAMLGHVLTWAILILAMASAFALLFKYGPACQNVSLRWLSPGSILAAVMATLLTFAFSFYVSSFGNYNATYGALGGVVVLLTWLWLTSYVILIGAECDVALIERPDTPDIPTV
ncbi:YihY/virulence factor BrkB family protein [Croceicoccus bisphenolivorans]|uniref:YihY/virulence factor BrkB family protein n=1 Tax=Croceicoccus bisphenolivorans TaxID=1783232 RepID=UPI001FE02125|nr:YihY/virulence factor BrkB family protein [Croceicoccus bisphenolivorans]